MIAAHLLKSLGTGSLAGVTVGTLQTLVVSSAGGTRYTPGNPAFLSGFANENLAVLVELLVYALLGGVCMLASEVYRSDRLSIATSTLAHLGLVGGSVLTAGWYLKWFSASTALGFAVVFLIIYTVIWVANYLRYRRTINAVNARLSER